MCIFLRHLGNCIDSTRVMHVLQLVFPSISPQCYFILCGELETLVSSVPQLQSSRLFTSVVCLFAFFFPNSTKFVSSEDLKVSTFPLLNLRVFSVRQGPMAAAHVFILAPVFLSERTVEG